MATARVERRLAAILAADVAGYSRLMERDEAGTLARLKALRGELVDPLVVGHRGRVVKLMGDGALVEFASAVDAVECAAAIQEGMAGRETDVPEAERVRFRIGVNLGDVIVEGDGDLYGDGVNVAARLEQLAEPGGIVVSGTAFDHLRGGLGRAFAPLGEQRLKNIERPVRAYRMVLGGGDDSRRPERPALPLPDRPSLAVLPFDNLSGDPEQGYFADGMVEDIIAGLSRIKPRPLRGGGQRRPQGRPIQSGPQHLPYAAGGGAREARAARGSQGCRGACLGTTTRIPVQPAVFRRGLRAGARRLPERGAPRHRAAGIALRPTLLAHPDRGERPLVAHG